MGKAPLGMMGQTVFQKFVAKSVTHPSLKGNRISILWADLMMTFPEMESGRVSAGHSNEVRFRITLYTANGKRQFVSRDLSFTAHYKKKIEIGFTPVSSIRIGLHSFHFRSILRKLSN